MAALSARDAFRYGGRLFGYLLVTTVLGGGLLAGGLGLAVTLEPAVLPGGAAPESFAAVAVGGLVAFLGVLVLAAGWLTVVLMTVADAVRLGVDDSTLGPATPSDDVSPSSPPADDADDPEPDPEPDADPEPDTADPLAGGDSDPFEDRGDPFDEPSTSDPLADPGGGAESQTGGSTDQRQAGPTAADDDEAWRREIEAKLDEQDEPRGSRPE